MSTAIVTKTHIDALVDLGRRWAETAPASQRMVLRRAALQPDELGALLWRANHDVFNFDGAPRALLLAEAPDDLAEIEAGGGMVVVPGLDDYTYAELPGEPHPAVAFKIVTAYLYQVADEPWGDGYFPEESAYLDALMAVLDGLVDVEHVRETSEYLAAPWVLENDDRDVFTR